MFNKFTRYAATLVSTLLAAKPIVPKLPVGDTFPLFIRHTARRIVPLSRRDWHWRKPHQGKQECARRRRQIERSQLKMDNGLTLHKGKRVLRYQGHEFRMAA